MAVDEGLSTYQNLHLWIVGLSAAASASVAVLAIFGGWVRDLLFGPKLKVLAHGGAPFVQQFSMQTTSLPPSGETWADIRIQVINAGRRCATSCQVLVDGIYETKADGKSLYQTGHLIPTAFPWADEPNATVKNLIPAVPTFITIARIEALRQTSLVDNEASLVGGPTYALRICIPDERSSESRFTVKAQPVVFPIIVYADNTRRTKKYYVELSWKGVVPNDTTDASKLSIQLVHEKSFKARTKACQ